MIQYYELNQKSNYFEPLILYRLIPAHLIRKPFELDGTNHIRRSNRFLAKAYESKSFITLIEDIYYSTCVHEIYMGAHEVHFVIFLNSHTYIWDPGNRTH